MEETKEETVAMLPLDATRVIRMKQSGREFVFKTRRINPSDWNGYYTGIVNQVLHVDGRRENVFESESSLLELVNNVVISAEGFGEFEGKFPIERVPFNLRIAVGAILRNVAPETVEDDLTTLSECIEIKLSALWPTEDGSKLYSGLVHRFRHPTLEQLKQFNFESSRVKVRGNGENGVSVYPSRQAIAMRIYDKLIESVDGYSVNGASLTGIENIWREMDGAHKAAAALQIFATGDEIQVE